MQWLVIVVLAALLQGCAANPFAKYYYPANIQGSTPRLPVSGEPRIVRGSNREADNIKMSEDGYQILGSSSFNGGNVNEDGVIDQAKAIGAGVVILYSQYTNTVTGSMPLTLPSSQTSTSSVSGMVGNTPVYGTGYTTTYGTTTTNIPYSINRSDYFATYWVPLGQPIVGVFIREPTADERKGIGSNAGLIVIAVRKGSPAFMADIFRGDVIMKIGESMLRERQDLSVAGATYAGQNVQIVLVRDGKELKKDIRLNRPE